MLEDALILDASGKPVRYKGRTYSSDWDEVQEFCRTVYMPYRVRPLEKYATPDATMLSRKAGRVTMTRFSYGTGIYLDRFDPTAGNIIVLNTLAGALNHGTADGSVSTAAGESFVVDCSRTEYWLEGDPNHMQFNLTIPHDVMAETAQRWFGFVPDDSLWTSRVKFGGVNSPWLKLLDYAATAINNRGDRSAAKVIGRHIEEIICLELLRAWAAAAGVTLTDGHRSAAPGYVRQAEEIFESEARSAPTVGDVAERVGVSARTLSGGFRRFRGISPREFLAARRMDGFRRDLELEQAHLSIAQIAAGWGFVSLGSLAAKYRQRFGELPSHTRLRAMSKW
ncbi:AraC family transcriptional regulator [Tateyamaria omphalii]|nr:AraC family transcriptional regulator [Tateyamaria omphalii]